MIYSLGKPAIIVSTIGATVLVFIVGILLKSIISYSPPEPGATLVSLMLGFLIVGIAILSFKGFSPFLQGLRPPLKVFLILWPLCTILQLGKFQIEITGNVVIDMLIAGSLTVLIAMIVSAGCWRLKFDNVVDIELLQTWVIASLFVSVVVRAVLWALR